MSPLKAGHVVEWSRAFTGADIAAFAELSGDKGRHHLERDGKGRLMAHGLLTASLPTKLGGDLHYIASEMRFTFLRPVYDGELLRCVGTVKSVRREPRYKRRAVSFAFVVTNPRGKAVLKGTTKGVIYDEQPAAAPAPAAVPAEAPPPAAEPAPRDRDGFMRNSPQAPAALVAELKALLPRLAALGADERDVLAHVLAYAGYGEDGRLRVPSFATLWGEKPSYMPAVRLEAERVAAAVRVLRRRGLLKPAEHDVYLDDAVLKALAG